MPWREPAQEYWDTKQSAGPAYLGAKIIKLSEMSKKIV